MSVDPQKEIVEAFNTYLAVAVVLTEDLVNLVETEVETESWRRNYIRAVSALIDGASHGLRILAKIGLTVDPSVISGREKDALRSGLGFTASERVELTFRAVHSMFKLGVDPNQPEKWAEAQLLIEKNDQLAHPKSQNDLAIPNETWPVLKAGAKWLTELHFGIVESIHRMRETGG